MILVALACLAFGLVVVMPIALFVYTKLMNRWIDKPPQNHRMPSVEEIREQRLKETWKR